MGRIGLRRLCGLLAVAALGAVPVAVVTATTAQATTVSVANGAELRTAWADATTTTITLTANITLGDSSGGATNDCTHGEPTRSAADGSAITVDGQGSFGITQTCTHQRVLFDGQSGETVTLTGLTHFTGGNSCGPGGGLYSEGSWVVTGSDVSDNAMSGTCVASAIPTPFPYGGGVYSNNGAGTITNSTFSGNHALEGGGAAAAPDDVSVTNSTFTHNDAGTACGEGCYGGALIVGGTATVTGSTFTSNAIGAKSGDVCGGCGIFGGAMAAEDANITGSTFTTNHADCSGECTDDGGATWTNASTTIGSSTFSGNTAECEGACDNAGGGAFSITNLSISGSTFSGNQVSCSDDCQAEGGAAFVGNNEVGKYKGRYPGVDAAAAGWFGGPHATANPTVTLSSSHFTANQAVCDGTNCGDDGGALYAAAPSAVTVTASTFDANTAKFYGGAVSIGGTQQLVPLTIVNSTITGNSSGQGGAIDGSDSFVDVVLAYDTIVGNHLVPVVVSDSAANDGKVRAADGTEPANLEAGHSLTSFGTIVTLPDGGPNCVLDGTSTSQGYNWTDDTSCEFAQTTDHEATPNDPELNALGDWGGPTPTMLPDTPLHGGALSPVVDAIPASACRTGVASAVTTDQRGITRPQDVTPAGGCDIGAVEVLGTEVQVAQVVVVQPKFTG